MINLVAVVGVKEEVHGENARAYATLAPGSAPPAVAERIDFARERVGYRAPEEVIVLDEMFLNPNGKVDRAGL
ncbi:MAG: long-chain fatty acid--CoA ligase, partial [Myxococcota bacterium]|nr:long-chain fatty acid--CoA ligase [Myxococcota bacterium]